MAPKVKLKAGFRKLLKWLSRHFQTSSVPERGIASATETGMAVASPSSVLDDPLEKAGATEGETTSRNILRRISRRLRITPQRHGLTQMGVASATEAGMAVASPTSVLNDPLAQAGAREEEITDENSPQEEISVNKFWDKTRGLKDIAHEIHIPVGRKQQNPGTKRKALLIGIAAINDKCDHSTRRMTQERSDTNTDGTYHHCDGDGCGMSREGTEQASAVNETPRVPKESELVEESHEIQEEPAHGVPRDSSPLLGPHKDVADTKALLIDIYKFNADDIITLVDNDQHPPTRQPTRANIKEQIQALVAGAQSGDRFYFHYSGHAGQRPQSKESMSAAHWKEEEDKMDEFICTVDDEEILDDELSEWLVKPLPVKSTLFAVFDCCHSGSILDLDHWRCNQVFLPWGNKGERRTASRHNIIRHKNALRPDYGTGHSIRFPEKQKSLDQVVETASEMSNGGILSPRPISSANLLDGDTPDNSRLQISSPENDFCTGWCRPFKFVHMDRSATVICLSSCADDEMTWEDRNGASMTDALVKFLNENHRPTLKQLVHHVSFALHACCLDTHALARGYRKQVKRANIKLEASGKPPIEPTPVEMNNFQTLQLSSHEPLDLDGQLWDP